MVDCALHDDVEMEKVVEVAIDLDDVGVIEIALYFYLSAELLHHVLISQILLGQYLDCTDEAALPIDCQHHSAIGTFAELLYDLEALD